MSTAAVARLPVRPPVPCAARAAAEAAAKPREWDKAHLLAAASYHCALCSGSGAVTTMGGVRMTACKCVRRRVFRACFYRWTRSEFSPRVRPIRTGGEIFSMPDREYAADFLRIARQACTVEQWRVLHIAYFMGLDYIHGCRATGLTKGNWFHRLYEAESAAGSALYERSPHSLYPIDQYFSQRPLSGVASSETRRTRHPRES